MHHKIVFPEPCVCVFAGVVDSEDIPLNLSRELLQESVLIRYSAANLFFLSIILAIHFFFVLTHLI